MPEVRPRHSRVERLANGGAVWIRCIVTQVQGRHGRCVGGSVERPKHVNTWDQRLIGESEIEDVRDRFAGVVFWQVRRRKRVAAPGAWMEASCPACIGVSLLAGRVLGLADLSRLDQIGSADPASRRPDPEHCQSVPAARIDARIASSSPSSGNFPSMRSPST